MVALFKWDDNIIPLQGKNNEWYTPSKYIEAAREVMGGIDLDPASCELANRTVKATRYYSKEQNGLSKPWYGCVWLNPPYGRSDDMKAKGKSTIEQFSTKLLAHYYAGDVMQAVFLGTAQLDGHWFQPFWQFPICFPDHKVKFVIPFEKRDNYAHMFGTVFVYLGPNEQKFIETFSQFGRIAKAIDTPLARVKTPELWEVPHV